MGQFHAELSEEKERRVYIHPLRDMCTFSYFFYDLSRSELVAKFRYRTLKKKVFHRNFKNRCVKPLLRKLKMFIRKIERVYLFRSIYVSKVKQKCDSVYRCQLITGIPDIKTKLWNIVFYYEIVKLGDGGISCSRSWASDERMSVPVPLGSLGLPTKCFHKKVRKISIIIFLLYL